jgi:hypothetical protein
LFDRFEQGRGRARVAAVLRRDHARARNNDPTTSKRPYTSVAVTAAVPAKAPVAMTRPTPTFRRAVVRVIVLR